MCIRDRFSFTSCNSVRVAADYDRSVTFETYQSFAFFKEGIDKAEISDLDKRRILRAIESEKKLKSMLFWDVNNGVARRNWARNKGANSAIKRAMESEPKLKITLPNCVDETLFDAI